MSKNQKQNKLSVAEIFKTLDEFAAKFPVSSAKVKEMLSDLKIKLESDEKNSRDLVAYVKVLEEKDAASTDQVSELETYVTTLEDKLKNSTNMYQISEGRLSKLKGDLVAIGHERDSLITEREHLIVQKNELEIQLGDINNNNNNSGLVPKKDLDASESQNKILVQSVKELGNRISNLEEQISELRKDKRCQSVTIANLDKELEELKNSNQSSPVSPIRSPNTSTTSLPRITLSELEDSRTHVTRTFVQPVSESTTIINVTPEAFLSSTQLLSANVKYEPNLNCKKPKADRDKIKEIRDNLEGDYKLMDDPIKSAASAMLAREGDCSDRDLLDVLRSVFNGTLIGSHLQMYWDMKATITVKDLQKLFWDFYFTKYTQKINSKKYTFAGPAGYANVILGNLIEFSVAQTETSAMRLYELIREKFIPENADSLRVEFETFQSEETLKQIDLSGIDEVYRTKVIQTVTNWHIMWNNAGFYRRCKAYVDLFGKSGKASSNSNSDNKSKEDNSNKYSFSSNKKKSFKPITSNDNNYNNSNYNNNNNSNYNSNNNSNNNYNNNNYNTNNNNKSSNNNYNPKNNNSNNNSNNNNSNSPKGEGSNSNGSASNPPSQIRNERSNGGPKGEKGSNAQSPTPAQQ